MTALEITPCNGLDAAGSLPWRGAYKKTPKSTKQYSIFNFFCAGSTCRTS